MALLPGGLGCLELSGAVLCSPTRKDASPSSASRPACRVWQPRVRGTTLGLVLCWQPRLGTWAPQARAPCVLLGQGGCRVPWFLPDSCFSPTARSLALLACVREEASRLRCHMHKSRRRVSWGTWPFLPNALMPTLRLIRVDAILS